MEKFEIVIKGGKLIDPAQGICSLRDIGLSKGKIASLVEDIPEHTADKILNANGLIITPGLIDIHTHVAEAIMPLSVNGDDVGVNVGVTAVCDQGSTGYANFNGFRKLVIPKAQTTIFSFIHLLPMGQAVIPEIGWQDINLDETMRIIDENRDVIKGIKVRAGAGIIEKLGLDIIKKAKKLSAQAKLPVAVHIGVGLEEWISDNELDTFTPNMLALLDKGDILVHVYTPRKGGVIGTKGRILPELDEAIKRGIVIDVASANSHFSFEIARNALEQGVLPTTISTDTVTTNINGPVVFSLPVIMSKFMALGLTLEQVIERTTMNPARVLGEEHQRGTLKVGMPADISVLELQKGNFVFFDGKAGNTLSGDWLLVPRLTLKNGLPITAQPRFKNYSREEPIYYPKGA